MPLTRSFRDTVKARADNDPAFRAALYQEGLENIIKGDLAVGKVLLRDFINATVGWRELSGRMRISEKSLMRMFSPTGNPHAGNFVQALGILSEQVGRVQLTVGSKPPATRRRTPDLVDA